MRRMVLDPRRPRQGNGPGGLLAGKGEDLTGKCASGALLPGAKEPGIALMLPDLPRRDGSAVRSGVRGRKQVANLARQLAAGIPRAGTWLQRGPLEAAEARARQYLQEPSGRSAPDAALSLQAPHLPGAPSSWRQLLADKGAKCSAQVLLGKGRRAGREQKRDRGHGIGAVPRLLAQWILHRYVFLLEPNRRDLTILMVDLVSSFL